MELTSAKLTILAGSHTEQFRLARWLDKRDLSFSSCGREFSVHMEAADVRAFLKDFKPKAEGRA